MSGAAPFVFLVALGALGVCVSMRSAWRRSQRDAGRVRRVRGARPRTTGPARGQRNPAGGRSSRPATNRRVRCGVYEIPSFVPRKLCYIGMSTYPAARIGKASNQNAHINKWWWKYTSPKVKVKVLGSNRYDVSGVKITWFDCEDDAYAYEQKRIAEAAPLFNIEGNHGRGIAGPTDPRVDELQRKYLASVKAA